MRNNTMLIASASPLDWEEVDSGGTGSISINDKGGVVSVSTAGGRYIKKPIPAYAGETIRVTVKARRMSGVDGTSTLGINYPAQSGLVNTVSINSDDWRFYSVEYTVPWDASETEYVTPSLGCFSGLAGGFEFQDLKIEVSNSSLPTARCYALGLVTVSSGSPEINTAYSDVGIYDVTVSAGELFVWMRKTPNLNVSPVPDVTLLGRSNLHISPRVADFDRVNGIIKIAFLNTTTGVSVDVSTLGVVNVFVKATGL